MKNNFKYLFLTYILMLSNALSFSQNQNKKWYFGGNAGLDFMTNPPSNILNSNINVLEGTSSIADATGNLLFYTDGVTVWNKLNQVMANGTGLFGNSSSSQSALIAKQPGNSNIYYVFTTDFEANPKGLCYSIVDIALSAGNGSVTVKNSLLITPSTEKLAGIRHCNGVDLWIMSHDYNSNNFRAYLLSSTGISPVPVLSPVGTVNTGIFSPNSGGMQGYIKFSPTNKQLATTFIDWALSTVELYDFDNSTGIVSNPLIVATRSYQPSFYDVEFSPDGTKLYGTTWLGDPKIYQWDLCAGSNSAIVSSIYTVYTASVFTNGLQRATDGKIYVSRLGQADIGIINNPNLTGNACNYTDIGLSLAPNFCSYGTVNFIFEKLPLQPFSYTINPSVVSCNTATFTAPAPPTITVTACSSVGYSLTNLIWNFGDPASGSSNTTTVTNPIHNYPGPGTYTAELIYYYTCGGGSDTIRQVVTVGALPINSVSGFTMCNGNSITLSATGAQSYTWSTGSNSNSIAVSPSTNSSYTVNGIDINGCANIGVITVTVLPLPTLTISGNSFACMGMPVIQLVSGALTYTWSNGANTNTVLLTPVVNTTYTVYGTDMYGCVNQNTVTLSVKPSPTITIAGNTTVCPGSSVTQTASGAASYFWSTGVTTNTAVLTPAANTIYTVTGTDMNGCNNTNTVLININSFPAVTGFTFNIPVCERSNNVLPLLVNGFDQGGVFSSPALNINPYTGAIDLSAASAGTYIINYFIQANGCVSAGNSTANIVILAAPDLNISPDINIIPGASTALSVSGGPSYTWSPASYLSCINCANPIASPPDNIQYCVSSELNGCINTKCIDITVTCEIGYDHSVPNAFTPNADGHNDAFCLQGWTDCITSFNVMIFDRWGEKVFESNNPSFCWDGIYKGELMNAGVFVYVIKATKKKELISKKGNITLIR